MSTSQQLAKVLASKSDDDLLTMVRVPQLAWAKKAAQRELAARQAARRIASA